MVPEETVRQSLDAKLLTALDMTSEIKDKKYKNLEKQDFSTLCRKRSFKDMFNETGLGQECLREIY